ncbi:MAG: hypothetical protein U5K56_13650 [Halioglobus sp.]|nr:hypothetical protein [Halioglobus sp.]
MFSATIGGLGLTGLITAARLRLRPIVSDRILAETIVFNSPEEFAQLSLESMDWEYTVSWVDIVARDNTIGRGIFSRARHCDRPGPLSPGAHGTKPGPPFSPPVSLINNWSVDLFNRAWFWLGSRRAGERQVHYQPFFFPLDGIANWNRAYGRGGFYQYQCVIPRDAGVDVLRELLQRIAASGEGSFLVVLKEFGERRSPGLMSFPRPGFTLALDFANRGERTLRLLDSLDEIVMPAGGALYPAKDARMSARTFHDSFPDTDAFAGYVDPGFSSSFWRRVTE